MQMVDEVQGDLGRGLTASTAGDVNINVSLQMQQGTLLDLRLHG